MPIYEYKCGKCGKVSEIVVGVVHKDGKIKCPECGSELMEKIISSTFTVIDAKNREVGSNKASCCGITNPCDNPKKCCGQ
jgi:putative FmdB family regulatory protein